MLFHLWQIQIIKPSLSLNSSFGGGGGGILNTCYNYSHWLSIVFHPVAGKSLWKQEVYELYCLFEYKITQINNS